MDSVIQLHDPADAQDFLTLFDAATRRKGEAYSANGRVLAIEGNEDGSVFTVSVRGSQLYQVRLVYDPDAGWESECSCPMSYDCKHAYAAMKALLAEHSLASVRDLSSGKPGKQEPPQEERKSVTPSDLPGLVIATLKRDLTNKERTFLSRLREVYRRCLVTRSISVWDFDQLGMSLGGYGWEGLNIWPSFPENEHEFWLYLAHHASSRHVPIPEFLQPVTDLAPVRQRLADWKRQQEIEQWKQRLRAMPIEASIPEPETIPAHDLRLVLKERSACLEIKRGSQEEFAELKSTPFHRLIEEHRSGHLALAADAEHLLLAFQNFALYGRAPEVVYQDQTAVPVLGLLLRQPWLAGRIVGENGAPFPRSSAPLRWKLEPPGADHQDYSMLLVREDGSALPPLWCTIPGRPILYLTSEGIFPGPASSANVLHPGRRNLIPPAVVESREGIAFLHGMRVSLPESLRQRIKTLPLKVLIECEARLPYPNAASEYCYVKVIAQSPEDGYKEGWDGSTWAPLPNSHSVRKSRADSQDVIVYDRAALARVPALLEPLGSKYDGYLRTLALRITRKFPELFVPWLKSLPPDIEVRLAGDLASLTEAAVSGRVRLDVSEAEIDWFDLRVVLDVSDTTLTPEELKLLLNAKGKFVRLADKGWRRLEFNITEEDDERLARLGLNPRDLSSEPQRLHALQLADDAARSFLPEKQVESIQLRASEIKTRVTPELPAGVSASLRPYQLEGFHFLAYLSSNRFGGILADDMGLGKTLQTLVWLLWLREQRAQGDRPGGGNGKASSAERVATPPGSAGPALPPSLVVCPKSVMDNWHAEAQRFTPALKVKVWPPSALDQFVRGLSEADLHVINYSQLRTLGESLVPVSFLAVILDEGQYIKNPSSQTAQIARALRAQHRLVLSGTPIENRLMDLWSLMSFAMPGVLSSRNHFGRVYDSKTDPLARRRLSARVRPFLTRRTKSQVAKDLPDRVEEDLFCEMEDEQKLLYRAELKRAQQMLLRVKTQTQLAKEQFHFLVSLLRLRQICCHPALVKPDSKAPGAKVEALLEQLEPIMAEGQKVLVFSQFVELLAMLKPLIKKAGWPLFMLTGETENRGDLVRSFQETEGSAVFLISLKAGGFGLNLTAASYVVLFDPWWNPAVENQAIDRTHRIGQANKVVAYRLLIKDSIEEKIRLLQKQKKALAEDVLGEEKFAQGLTLDDFHYLFAD